MGFQKFDGSNAGRGPAVHPRVTAWSSGMLAFNRPAVDEWLHGADHVEVFVHDTEPVVGIRPVTEETSSSYVLHTKGNYNGKVLHARALLKDMRCERPDESTILDSRINEEKSWVEVDLSPLLKAL